VGKPQAPRQRLSNLYQTGPDQCGKRYGTALARSVSGVRALWKAEIVSFGEWGIVVFAAGRASGWDDEQSRVGWTTGARFFLVIVDVLWVERYNK